MRIKRGKRKSVHRLKVHRQKNLVAAERCDVTTAIASRNHAANERERTRSRLQSRAARIIGMYLDCQHGGRELAEHGALVGA